MIFISAWYEPTLHRMSKIMKKHIVIFLILIFPCLVFASEDCDSGEESCTITCDNAADDVDFIQAISDVDAGTTINVAAGTCDIEARINITKSVNLIGAGKTSTTLVNAYAPSLSDGTLDLDIPLDKLTF